MKIVWSISIFSIAFSLCGMNKNNYLVTKFGLSPAQAKKVKKTAQAWLQATEQQYALENAKKLENKKKIEDLIKCMRVWEAKFASGTELEKHEAPTKIAAIQKEIATIESSSL